MPRQSPYVIGIVGLIGSGKSSVAEHLERLGAERLDADRVCHQLLQEQEVIEAVVGTFGSGILDGDGQVDRQALADLVFEDKRKLDELNTILHPRVQVILDEAIERIGQRPDAVVALEVALLVESGMCGMCDCILYVDAGEELRKRRVAGSRKWSEGELARREQYQAGEAEKRAVATTIIDNNRTNEETNRQLTEFWRDLFKVRFHADSKTKDQQDR